MIENDVNRQRSTDTLGSFSVNYNGKLILAICIN